MKKDGCEVLVSIFLVIHNDQKWLKELLPTLYEDIKCINYELIIVDNASKDNSVLYLKSYEKVFSLKTIKNKKKVSFSFANNQAAKEASGKYIVLLKAGIIPLKGWLDNLVNCADNESKVGAVGASLAPQYSSIHSWVRKIARQNEPLSHQTGIVFSDEVSHCRPYCLTEELPIATGLKSSSRSVVSSSCLLVLRSVYNLVGGLDESFNECGEDIDFALKLHKLGYANKCSKNAVLIKKQPFLWKQRLSNIERADLSKVQEKWFHTIRQSYWSEKIFGGTKLFTETRLHIAIAVTDHGQSVTAGDYFTAQELAHALGAYGWDVTYLSRKKGEWYKIPESVDVVLNLLDAYDLNKIPLRNKRLLKIAWARNWFDRWCEMSCFNDYDLVFSSSQKSCVYINENSRQAALLLPIASNPDRFRNPPNCSNLDIYKSEVCFTGSYWDHPRDIIDGVSQEILDKYDFSIFGAHWEKVDKFKEYTKGFLEYDEIPCVYHQTKIVIDDANHVTKPYGSVNSRVFDAIMSGALVITNGFEGSNELFDGKLPFYADQASLTKLINYYLSNEDKRREKIKTLKRVVLEKHTYKQRAETFRSALIERFLLASIAIKIPAPSWEDACNWGDYHMATALKQELEKENFRVVLQVLPEWNNDEGKECDAVIVLRGLSRYSVNSNQINIMWNISHPDKVTLEEYEEYDQVYIASELWAEKISKQVSVPVEAMLQCTNPDVFYEPTNQEKTIYKEQLLYVGNSRKVHRKALQDLLPTDYNLSVYGKNWEGIIPSKYLKADHIPNGNLYKYYGSADILLNDHWGDMREKGFISNRIFDGLACGAVIVTDRVEAMGELESFVNVYDTKIDLEKMIKNCLFFSREHRGQINLGKEFVLRKHTFKHRAGHISKYIKLKIGLDVKTRLFINSLSK